MSNDDCYKITKSEADKICLSPCLIIDNVWNLYNDILSLSKVDGGLAAHGKETFDFEKDFPLCVPPYKSMFVEYDASGPIGEICKLKQVGWYVKTFEIDRLDDQYRNNFTAPHLAGGKLYHFGSPWICGSLTSGRAARMFCGFGWVTSADGTILGTKRIKSTEDDKEIIISQHVIPLLLAFSFCNAKNVKEIEEHITGNRIGAKVRKKEPTLRYYVLEIDGIKRTLETEGDIANVGLKKALHLCRGHFAFYGENNKLFGKYTGMVWRSQHVRGNAKQGVVVKDYAVKPGT